MDSPLRIGDIFLGKYEIRSVIGRGGHAFVYQAVNAFMGRHVALKVLHRPGGLTEEMLHRGQQEAQLLGRLAHPSIVQVFDAGIEQGQLYIVMEYLRGQSLLDVLRRFGRLHVQEVVELFVPIAEGLETAHQQDAIHRDLKPANIFITSGNQPRILDFGIAKVLGVSKWETHHNYVVGTPAYMSPEQLLGRSATPRSDLYAIGSILYEAFCGRHPMDVLADGRRWTRDELIRAQIREMPPPLDVVVPGFPESFARLVHALLAKEPGQRLESARQLAAYLRRYGAAHGAAHPHLPPARNLWEAEVGAGVVTGMLQGTEQDRGSRPAPAPAANEGAGEAFADTQLMTGVPWGAEASQQVSAHPERSSVNPTVAATRPAASGADGDRKSDAGARLSDSPQATVRRSRPPGGATGERSSTPPGSASQERSWMSPAVWAVVLGGVVVGLSVTTLLLPKKGSSKDGAHEEVVVLDAFPGEPEPDQMPAQEISVVIPEPVIDLPAETPNAVQPGVEPEAPTPSSPTSSKTSPPKSTASKSSPPKSTSSASASSKTTSPSNDAAAERMETSLRMIEEEMRLEEERRSKSAQSSAR